ncbi:hypothetical protein [Cryobacterium sp. Y57]|nr:hypothetical protein [Cryobacterium sp. Y57]
MIVLFSLNLRGQLTAALVDSMACTKQVIHVLQRSRNFFHLVTLDAR